MATETPRAHAIDRVLSLALEPWAVTRPMLAIIARVLGRRLSGDPFGFDDDDFERRPPSGPVVAHGIALVPVHGILAPRLNALSDFSGGATYESFGRTLDAAVANPDVRTIVLDIDSPGGSVLGASEHARRIMAARVQKPIVAQVHYQACSAAYWLAACATEIAAAPSSTLGAIGVYTIHEDLSAQLEQLGVKTTYISAGKFKVDGNETEPLSDSARAHLQKQVDAHYARFVGDVAKGRGVTDGAVRDGFGQGATVTADEALAARMIDRVATLEDTLARLAPARAAAPLRAEDFTPPPPADTPHEPARATGHDRARVRREAEAALLALSL
jgi:signal peptide peptidase SppA